MSFGHAYARHAWLPLGLLLVILSGCSFQVSTEQIRSDIAAGNFESLSQALNDSFEDRPVLMNGLNLARFYQFQGQWDESIKYFGLSLAMLEEYEQRAIVNVRCMGAKVGTLTLSRGSADNFGTGYERSLLHTFNGLNYAMKGDFQGAAVEMRRMETRQELWLEESSQRLKERLEEAADKAGEEEAELPGLPADYSLSSILSSPELRHVVNSYQDPFSYALSAIICRIYGDNEYARISLGRACQLDERAYQMFRQVWQRPTVNIRDESAKARRWEPALLPLPRRYREGAKDNPPNQELTLIIFGGLGPAIKMEQMRIPYPYVGYIMIDLPSYEPEIMPRMPQISLPAGDITPYPLLRTDLLAYRNLRDEISYEMAAAISRAVTRAAVAVGGTAVAASHRDSEGFAPIIGFLLTLAMDAYASSDNDNVRNWELLPARGYLGLGEVPRGSTITLTFAETEYNIELPKEARGIIVLASQVENANLKVDYVTY